MVALNTDPERWTSSETYMITEIHGMGVAELFKVLIAELNARGWTLDDLVANQSKVAFGVVKHAMEAFMIGAGTIGEPSKTAVQKHAAMLEPYQILGKSIATALAEEGTDSKAN